MDRLAASGLTGMAETVPAAFHPGSDVANLSVFGYDPATCYTGRSPLEAASMGVELGPDDVAFRLNLVTLEAHCGDLYMQDFSAGHISTAEARRTDRHPAGGTRRRDLPVLSRRLLSAPDGLARRS